MSRNPRASRKAMNSAHPSSRSLLDVAKRGRRKKKSRFLTINCHFVYRSFSFALELLFFAPDE